MTYIERESILVPLTTAPELRVATDIRLLVLGATQQRHHRQASRSDSSMPTYHRGDASPVMASLRKRRAVGSCGGRLYRVHFVLTIFRKVKKLKEVAYTSFRTAVPITAGPLGQS